MAKRITSEQAMVEYKGSSNYRRVTSEQAMVEYYDTNNYRRVTQLLVMVEYQQNAGPAGRVLGPAVQVMS